jgi:hypothetical protein
VASVNNTCAPFILDREPRETSTTRSPSPTSAGCSWKNPQGVPVMIPSRSRRLDSASGASVCPSSSVTFDIYIYIYIYVSLLTSPSRTMNIHFFFDWVVCHVNITIIWCTTRSLWFDVIGGVWCLKSIIWFVLHFLALQRLLALISRYEQGRIRVHFSSGHQQVLYVLY